MPKVAFGRVVGTDESLSFRDGLGSYDVREVRPAPKLTADTGPAHDTRARNNYRTGPGM